VADKAPIKDPGALKAFAPDDVALVGGLKRVAGDLMFQDPNANGGSPLTLSDLAAAGSGNVISPGGEAAGNLTEWTGPNQVGDTGVATTAVTDHIASTADPHSTIALADARYPQVTATPSDDELVVSDGTITSLVGGEARLSETLSVGVVGDPDDLVIDAGGGNVDIVDHVGMFKESASLLAKVRRQAVSGLTANVIPLDTLQYVGVDYNGGTPIAIVTPEDSDFNLLTQYPLAAVSRDAAGVHITPIVFPLTEFSTKLLARMLATEPIAYDEGLLLATSGGGGANVKVTDGSIFVLLSRKQFFGPGGPFVDFDTSVSGTIDVWTGSVGGAFGVATALTLYPDDQFNDGTATPATLSNGRFGVIWWYLDGQTGEVLGFLGTSNSNSLAGAEAETAPGQGELPPRLVSTVLIGRYLITKGVPASTVVEIAWGAKSFSGTPVQSHLQLSDLGTGDAGHTDLQLRSEKTQPSGYPSLDGSAIVVEPAQVVRTTDGPTNLTVGSIADGEVVKRVGSTLVGDASGGGATEQPIGCRTRTTAVTGLSTLASFIAFDQEDSDVGAAFFTYAAGVFTAQKTFTALIYTEGSMAWESGSEAKGGVDIVLNDSLNKGFSRGNVYSTLIQNNHMAASVTIDFVLNDTLKIYWYTTIGGMGLAAGTPRIVIMPKELV